MIIFVTATADDKATTFLQVHNLVKKTLKSYIFHEVYIATAAFRSELQRCP